MKFSGRYAATALLQALSVQGSASLARHEVVDLEMRSSSASDGTIKPISVAPSQYWDGIDGQWSSFELQVGTAAQNIRVFPSLNAFEVVVVSAAGGCPSSNAPVNCANNRGTLFDSTKSLSWQANGNYTLGIEYLLNDDISGTFGFDTVTIGWQGSGAPTTNHSIIAEISPYEYFLGFFPLNPEPSNFSGFADPQPSLMQQLKNTSQIPSLSYGYTAGAQYRFDSVFGSLTLGGYDAARFQGTNITLPMQDNDNQELVIAIETIFSTNSQTELLPGGGVYALIDSTQPYIWLPEAACQAFEQEFGLVWNSEYELYLVNSSLHEKLLQSNPVITFNIATAISGPVLPIAMPYAAFDLNISYPLIAGNESMGYFPLKRAQNSTQYTLGRTFLQEAYLIADYERRELTVAAANWQGNFQTENIQTIEPLNGASGSVKIVTISGGAIAGIVIGALALFAIIGFAIWFFVFKRRRDRRRKAELDALDTQVSRDAARAAATSGGQTPADTVQTPLGGELASSQVHEMNAPEKPVYSELEDRKSPSYGGSYMKFTPNEMEGNTPVYEMPGDLHYAELDTPDGGTPLQKPVDKK